MQKWHVHQGMTRKLCVCKRESNKHCRATANPNAAPVSGRCDPQANPDAPCLAQGQTQSVGAFLGNTLLC